MFLRKEKIDFKILKKDGELDIENSFQFERILYHTKRTADNTKIIANIMIFFLVTTILSFLLLILR